MTVYNINYPTYILLLSIDVNTFRSVYYNLTTVLIGEQRSEFDADDLAIESHPHKYTFMGQIGNQNIVELFKI